MDQDLNRSPHAAHLLHLPCPSTASVLNTAWRPLAAAGRSYRVPAQAEL
jgi:hypothetical protein